MQVFEDSSFSPGFVRQSWLSQIAKNTLGVTSDKRFDLELGNSLDSRVHNTRMLAYYIKSLVQYSFVTS